MNLVSELRNYLIQKSGIISTVNTRIFPGIVRSTTQRPYLTIELINYEGEYSIDGASPLARYSYQFDIVSELYKDVFNTAEALRNSLDGYFGTIGTTKVQGTEILSMFEDSFLQVRGNSEIIVFQRSVDIEFIIEQALPTAL